MDDRWPAQGTKTPCTANRVLSSEFTFPSAPASQSCTWPIPQVLRLPSGVMLPAIASAVVETEQVDPTVVSPVGTHGTVTGSAGA